MCLDKGNRIIKNPFSKRKNIGYLGVSRYLWGSERYTLIPKDIRETHPGKEQDFIVMIFL